MKGYIHKIFFTAWGLTDDGKGGLREMTQEELHGDDTSLASRMAKHLAESMQTLEPKTRIDTKRPKKG